MTDEKLGICDGFPAHPVILYVTWCCNLSQSFAVTAWCLNADILCGFYFQSHNISN